MSQVTTAGPGVRPAPSPAAQGGGAKFFVLLAVVQGLYFVATGVWPLVHMESFLAVTGPKTDLWLVNTVGVLVLAVGLVLLLAAWRRQATAEVFLLAVGSALALTGIDVVYTLRGVIPPVYLVDAVAEVVLVLGWLGLAAQRGVQAKRPTSPSAV